MKFLLVLCLSSAAPILARPPAGDFKDAYGGRFNPAPVQSDRLTPAPKDVIHRWNHIALDATGLDHTPVAPGENRIFGQQLGPGRSSRAMAIVHIAMFDAINGIEAEYRSYTGIKGGHGVSVEAAVATAAHDTLSALFSSQKATFDDLLAEELSRIQEGGEGGVELGHRIAVKLLAMRDGDGSEIPEPRLGVDYFTSNKPGHWRQDPISQVPIALGAHWGECKPFVLQSTRQFRAPPPPPMPGPLYAEAYDEAKKLGGDGVATPTLRTPGETFLGTFWAYDGTPSLCAPPRLYNQIAITIADQTNLRPLELARLLALVNTAMADTAMTTWESKYHYDFWRPITGIRESDPGTGPTGRGDGNPATDGDPNFTPLGAPASNLNGPNFTPPFPSYPSGHAAIGGALFQVIRRFYGTDNLPFTFVSDEFNGITKDNQGNVRPYRRRSFSTLSQAAEENGQSRIYLGIHWSFDKTEGIKQGREVADYIFEHAFQPACDNH